MTGTHPLQFDVIISSSATKCQRIPAATLNPEFSKIIQKFPLQTQREFETFCADQTMETLPLLTLKKMSSRMVLVIVRMEASAAPEPTALRTMEV